MDKRSLFLNQIIPSIDDTIIAIISAVVLFILPSRNKNESLLGWNDAVNFALGNIIIIWWWNGNST